MLSVKHLDDILGSWPWLSSEVVELLVMLKKNAMGVAGLQTHRTSSDKISFEPGWFTYATELLEEGTPRKKTRQPRA